MVALANPFTDLGDLGPFTRDGSLAALLFDDLVGDRPPWAADALCIEFPGLSWFPTRGEPVDAQKAICRRCLVRTECAAWALDRADIVGIWGGTSSKARMEARTLGLDVAGLLAAVDTRCVASGTPSKWETAPCRGCAGLLSRRDLGVGDGWCWACRPIAKPDRSTNRNPADPEMRACSSCEELKPVSELDLHGGYWCTRCW